MAQGSGGSVSRAGGSMAASLAYGPYAHFGNGLRQRTTRGTVLGPHFGSRNMPVLCRRIAIWPGRRSAGEGGHPHRGAPVFIRISACAPTCACRSAWRDSVRPRLGRAFFTHGQICLPFLFGHKAAARAPDKMRALSRMGMRAKAAAFHVEHTGKTGQGRRFKKDALGLEQMVQKQVQGIVTHGVQAAHKGAHGAAYQG